jgi:hypothetical protein
MGFGLFAGFLAWTWIFVWTINSVLLMVLLWKLIERFSKKK